VERTSGNTKFIFSTGNLMVLASRTTYLKRSPTIRSNAMNRLYATTAILLLSGGLALAQGQGLAPGFNPSNPQDLTSRGNPQSQTLPGANDRNDSDRGSSVPRATSPAPSFGNGIRSGPLR
jgi:hypothetical protein